MIKIMKFIVVLIVMLIITTNVVNATTKNYDMGPPIADVYKEGIYHFTESIGNKLTLKLETPDEPMILIMTENKDNSLKFYIEFTKDNPMIEITLDNPLSDHTTAMLGKGEISFTFK